MDKILKRKFYKVVEEVGRRLVSSTVNGYTAYRLCEIDSGYSVPPSGNPLKRVPGGTKMTVVYKPGKFVKAKAPLRKAGLHLMVFKTLKRARQYAASTDQIWECSVTKTTSKIPYLASIGWAPSGSVMAHAVRLDRRLG